MNNQVKLTISNWKSEYERLKIRYKRLNDKMSAEAIGYLDHMRAVHSIIKEIEDKPLV